MILNPKKDAFEKKRPLTNVSEMDLLKAMIRGDQVAGYNLRKLVRTVWNAPKDLTAKLIRVYTGEKFNGYVFELENKSYRSIELDLKKISLGHSNLALLSQVDLAKLDPKNKANNKTLLRIVARPGSTYDDVLLPIETVKEKK